MSKLIIEVVTDSVASCVNAEVGGADRVELCDNLFEGGTTPSAGMIKHVREKVSIGLMVMIRPRGGDFLYSDEEFEVMKEDIRVAKSLGVDGVVFGLLTPKGKIDKVKTKELIDIARPLSVTFHRAFDMVADPFQALEDLIDLGVDRILTAGQERTAPEGIDLLKDLMEKAGDRIIILAGGGIRPYNIEKIVSKTGVKECHVSGKQLVESKMEFRNERVALGGSLQQPEYGISLVQSDTIASFRK